MGKGRGGNAYTYSRWVSMLPTSIGKARLLEVSRYFPFVHCFIYTCSQINSRRINESARE